MNTKPPRPSGLAALAIFLLACFGLTLFMWLTFGGSGPLQAKSYRVTAPFPDAGLIAGQADVRVAGVNVGKVVQRSVSSGGGNTSLELEIFPEYAPLRAQTGAVLRQKTILGETYVELKLGDPQAPIIQDGGELDIARIQPTSRLDDVLRTFDEPTRDAFATWLTEQGTALRGGGPALSAALAQLSPLGKYGSDVLQILDRQGEDLTALIRDGGASLAALSARGGQLRNLVRDSRVVFRTTADRDRALAALFEEMPGFLRDTRATVDRFADFSDTALPVVNQLRPAARELSPVLQATGALAPGLRRLLTAVGPLEQASREGLPALRTVLDSSVPFLKRLRPYLGTLIPTIDYIDDYRSELAAFFANVSAATQATLPHADGKTGPIHLARASLPINPESLAAFPSRLSSNRANAYPQPGNYETLLNGLELFDAPSCGGSALPVLSDSITGRSRRDIEEFFFTADPSGPACKTQAPLGNLVDQTLRFPLLEALK